MYRLETHQSIRVLFNFSKIKIVIKPTTQYLKSLLTQGTGLPCGHRNQDVAKIQMINRCSKRCPL